MSHPLIRPSLNSALNRRTFLRAAGIGAAMLGGGGLLTACGSDEPAAGTTSSSAVETSAAGSASSAAATEAASGTAAAVAPGTYGDIKVQLSWITNIEFAGEFTADEQGYYTEAGFSKVELITGPVASADELVATGNVLVGLSAPDATTRYILDQGAPLKIIGSTFQKNPFCILSLEEGKPIRTPADLKGKKIGIQAGTNQEIFKGFLTANSLTEADVIFEIVQYDPAPLLENKVDGFMAYATNEPFLAEAAGKTPVVLLFSDNGLPLTAGTFTVTQDSIDNDREMLKAFLWAEIRGWKDATSDPAAAAKLVVDKFGAELTQLTVEGQTEEMTAQNDLVLSADTETNGLFTLTDQKVAEIVEAIALTGHEISVEELFDLSLLAEVYAEHPELI